LTSGPVTVTFVRRIPLRLRQHNGHSLARWHAVSLDRHSPA
jgi:hypothetical protein